MSLSSHVRAEAQSPRDLLSDEMRRQNADALASLDTNRERAAEIAARLRQSGRLLLLGMGASHWANRMAVAFYRAAGIDAHAEPISEDLRQPETPFERVVMLTSQSGNSGEVRLWLNRNPDRADVFGLTLQADSVLGSSVPSLIGAGPREIPFAATRSIVITLALHAAVLEALGSDVSDLRTLWAQPFTHPDLPQAAVSALSGCSSLFLATRGECVPALECCALTYMELARTPAIALELGQLIHGPQEALGPSTALLLVRPAGPDAMNITRFAWQARSWGVPLVMFDIGDDMPDVEGATIIRLPQAEGLAAIARVLPAVQALVIDAAAERVPDMGVPQRSSKVTDGEG